MKSILHYLSVGKGPKLRHSSRLQSGQFENIDRRGFHLRLKGDRIHGRRVAFLREVRDAEDARAVFVEMVRQAKSPEVV